MPDTNLIPAAVAVAAALYLLARGRTGVAEHERLVVFRLGRCIGQRGPGTAFLVPVVDRGVRVSLRETSLEVAPHRAVTQDGEPIHADLRIHWKVVDPIRAVLSVQDPAEALRRRALIMLDEGVAKMDLGEVHFGRGQIIQDLRTGLHQVAKDRGLQVTGVEMSTFSSPREAGSHQEGRKSEEGVRPGQK
jgi:regulator of protease activity HflC (stomatin/prohibitin superfamily)